MDAEYIKASVYRKLLERIDLRQLDLTETATPEIRKKMEKMAIEILSEMSPLNGNIMELIREIVDEALGLGPIEDLMMDPKVSEIMINGVDEIYVEKDGRIERTDKRFSSEHSLTTIIERILSRTGRRLDESSPIVDARLPDGSRFNAIIKPISLKGPVITIRKFSKELLSMDDLIALGSITEEAAEFLKICVRTRRNIIISGGTGSGKTTLLNILSSFIPDGERIITIEDAAELKLLQPHVIPLEARPPNLEGKGAITIRDLVRNALRMRPDRIIVGECRGGEALDMLQAMNTGHDGSITTAHANSPRDLLSRLETMVLMSQMDLPVKAIREQIASSINIIVHQVRFFCGTRKITHITEICGIENGVILTQDIFLFRQSGFDSNGRVIGKLIPTGMIPKFYEDLKQRGLSLDISIFSRGDDLWNS